MEPNPVSPSKSSFVFVPSSATQPTANLVPSSAAKTARVKRELEETAKNEKAENLEAVKKRATRLKCNLFGTIPTPADPEKEEKLNRSQEKLLTHRNDVRLPELNDSIALVGMDYKMKYSVEVKGRIYDLEPMHSGAVVRDHQVWKAKADGEEFIIKSYWHQINGKRTHIVNLINADSEGYNFFTKFFKDQNVLGIRLATLHSDPVTDGIMIMEYAKCKEGMDEYWTAWKGDVAFAELSEESKQILGRARGLIELMWRTKTDVGDFKPENVVVDPSGEFVIIDWTTEIPKNFVHNLQFYVEAWAQDNPSVTAFLYENLADLQKAEVDQSL